MGQLHRIKHLERVFAYLAAHAGSISNAPRSPVLATAPPTQRRPLSRPGDLPACMFRGRAG
jgi:hypothetical protein